MERNAGWACALVSLSVAASCGELQAAEAGAVAEFYKGKTITMYVSGSAASGAVLAYPRSMSEVIRKYIPGNPNLIISYMPGAGGVKLANFIQSVGPKDGTAWAFNSRGFLLAPMLKMSGAEFDPTKFNWIGSPARSISVGAVWTASTSVRTIQDAMTTEVALGATTPGQDTSVFPLALNALIGTKFKVVTGYQSVGEVDLAMEKGEVQGKVGFTWNSLNSGRSVNWVKDKTVTVLVQFGLEKHPDIPADVPLALDLVKNADDRKLLEVIIGPGALGYPSFMSGDVPKERIDAIRAAVSATVKDPQFIEIMKRQSLDLDPIDADELAQTVRNIYSAPQAVVDRASKLLPHI